MIELLVAVVILVVIMLAFGMMRLSYAGAYEHDYAWFIFWEETTKLLFVAGAACVLWIFRRGLFANGAPRGLATGGAHSPR